MHSRGIKIGVFAPYIRSPWQRRKFDKFDLAASPFPEITPIVKNWRFFIPGALATCWRSHVKVLFEKYIVEYGRPDVIHAHTMLYAGIAALPIANKYGIPLILTEHHSRHLDNSFKPWQKKMVYRELNQIDHGIAVSGRLRTAILEHLNKRTDCWTVIPNMIEDQFVKKPIGSKEEIKEFRFIVIGNLVPIKRHDLILNAFSAMQDDSPIKLNLEIVGSGNLELKLKQLVEEKHLSKIVQFRGVLNRQELLDAIDNSHALISSSSHETFGLVICEALARGKPVISTRSGGPDEIINAENGILIPVDDLYALIGAIKQMIRDYSSFNPETIRNSAIKLYSSEAIVHQLMSYYSKILSQ